MQRDYNWDLLWLITVITHLLNQESLLLWPIDVGENNNKPWIFRLISLSEGNQSQWWNGDIMRYHMDLFE